MKKILVVITAIIITGSAYAQTEQKHPNNSDTVLYQTSTNMHPDGFMLKNGKMMCVKDQKMTLLKNDTTLMNGTIVMSNGNFQKIGGTKTMFKEGQHMDLNGKMIMMSSSKKWDGKKMYLIKDTTKNENK